MARICLWLSFPAGEGQDADAVRSPPDATPLMDSFQNNRRALNLEEGC